MTFRQKIMKLIYPVLMNLGKWFGIKAAIIHNKENIQPHVSFYTLSFTGNKGNLVNFSQYKNKKVLLVNTATGCGYTEQFNELQKLQDTFPESLVVLGFPSNDFKEQEKGNDKEIAAFCAINFNLRFPLMQKSIVIKGAAQNDVYKWLTQDHQNGWNNKPPAWNFYKYLINESGALTHYFDTAISPLDKKIINAVRT